jgi:chromosome segregation ATPase
MFAMVMKQNETLVEQHDATQKQLGRLTTQNESLIEQHETLIEQHDATQKQLGLLSTQFIALHEEVTALKDHFVQFKDRVVHDMSDIVDLVTGLYDCIPDLRDDLEVEIRTIQETFDNKCSDLSDRIDRTKTELTREIHRNLRHGERDRQTDHRDVSYETSNESFSLSDEGSPLPSGSSRRTGSNAVP